MAFQRPQFTDFQKFLSQSRRLHPKCSFAAHNFCLEERLSPAREDAYARYLRTPMAFDPWIDYHKDYLYDRILISGSDPETFRDDNRGNFYDNLNENQFLVRLENMDSLLIDTSTNETLSTLEEICQRFIINPRDQDAQIRLQRFFWDCNRRRDHRPTFVGFWDEIKNLFEPNENPDWADLVRDRFGLGHYDPRSAGPIQVLLLLYRISDVKQTRPPNRPYAAIPTVLDGSLSPFFCPTPSTLKEGQTLDLSPGGADDYHLSCEILHRHIDLQPEQVFRVGWITRPFGKALEEARRIHLEFLDSDFPYWELCQAETP